MWSIGLVAFMASVAPVHAQAPSLTINPSSFEAVSCGAAAASTNCSVSSWSAWPTPFTIILNNTTPSAYNVQNGASLAVTAQSQTVTVGSSGTYALGLFGTGASRYIVPFSHPDNSGDAAQATTEDGAPESAINGPGLTLNSAANITMPNYQAVTTTGVLDLISTGADGSTVEVKNQTFFPPQPPYVGGNGGPVSVGLSGQVNATSTAVTGGGSIPAMAAGIGAYSKGGPGGSVNNANSCCVGNGGNGGTVSITTTSGSLIDITSNVSAPAVGIQAMSIGGTSAFASFQWGLSSAASTGGSGGQITVDHAGNIIANGPSGTVGILAASLGATGQAQTGQFTASGNGGPVTVTVEQGGGITAGGGGTNVGVAALSVAGAASQGFGGQSSGTVTVTNNGIINTGSSAGHLSIGVLALSSGTGSVLNLLGTPSFTGTSGTGFGGPVTVTNPGSITTSGELSAGIAAVSVGGAGVTAAANGTATLGNSGTYYPAVAPQGVTVNNSGTITTNGASAIGIVAESTGGGGGLLDISGGSTAMVGGNDNGSSGNAGASVNVTNSGAITTGSSAGGGNAAIGIIAQSIGGGGGTAGGSAPALFVGGNGGSGGDGGPVTITTSGSAITTNNDGAIGILAQSVGGGGGSGANAAGIFVATGGEGGNGGNGNTVTVNLGGPISTLGDYAAGTIAQSIGGGGGNGGYAKSAGAFVSAAIGGTGGSGGAGGTVNITNSGTINTQGEQSLGLLAQSVGGGGGNGGAATSYAAGIAFSASLAIGGTGGGGGNGGQVSVNNEYHISTSGADSIGIVAQSIGGGGGNGGSALAKSLAVAGDPEVPTLSFAVSLGGSGGSGGTGGSVSVSSIGEIATSSDGGHGIVAQSIGGGGGNGGDSTATAKAIEAASPTVKIAVALGATGGNGGGGGPVTMAIQKCTTCVSSIATQGNYASGIVAQSIGGGGGTSTAGAGSTSSPNLGGDTGTSVSLGFSLGASGGAGGLGSTVNVTTAAGATISTIGSGSRAILAQSIGGGGGSAGGGSASGSGDTLNINVSLGGSGGSGNTGGLVTVTNAATITTGHNSGPLTTGGDAAGILAQSIGGGGGVAGSSDPAASVGPGSQVEDWLNAPSNAYSANVGVGGTGGTGGNGGTVQVSNSGAITTYGIRAYGIAAQSIGAGGGSGGAANAAANSVLGGPTQNNEGATVSSTYAATVAVGGSGGAAGNGGDITVNNTAAILTAGYGAHAILAQSIGAGGGVGAEGTVNNTTTLGLGVGYSGSGGASGGGGNVTVTSSSLTTLGDDAYGILAQSIGGGGGNASAGCSNSGAAGVQGYSATACFGNTNTGVGGSAAPWNDSSSISLNVGGKNGASGNGLNVAVTENGAIVTTGNRSFGIVAQSIGSGGGIATAAAQNIFGTSVSPTPGANSSTGAPVTVTLTSSGSITTSGAGAWGILAQSIGGGGGFSGDPSLPFALPAANTLPQTGSGNAFGNSVTVNVAGDITTTGSNAHGIFAQSIGGSGGIVAGCCNSRTAQLIAGNTAQFRGTSNSTYWGSGGPINITQSSGSTIKTSGPGSVAIIAQSSGTSGSVNPINVTIGGMVLGGTMSGYSGGSGSVGAAGIFVNGGCSATGQSGCANNAIVVNAGASVGTVDGVIGTAMLSTYGLTDVSNTGTITGSINLGSTPGTITNNSGGQLNTGPTVVVSTLSNSGMVNVYGPNTIGTTDLTGAFTQTSGGTLQADINVLASPKVDLLNVSSNATVGGTVAPVASALLPGSYTVLTADSLSSSAAAASALLFNWTLNATSTSLSLSPSANFTPSAVSLTSSEASLAGYLTTAWNNSDSQFARLFGTMSQMTSGSSYTSMLDTLSPKAVMALPTALANSSGTVLGASMSCPVFYDAGTVLGEDNCVWAKFSGGQTSQYEANDTNGYRVAGTVFRVGAQHAIAPNLYLGGAFGFGQAWGTMNGGSEGSGQTFDGSVAVKYTMGPWLVGGSFGIASGSYKNQQLVALPAAGTVPASTALVQSKPDIILVGGRLRGAYDFAFSDWYVRPYADLDVVYSNVPGFDETGQGSYRLSVNGSSKTSVVFSPMVELGGRHDIDKDTILRPYVAVGLSVVPNNTRTVDASFIGALPGDGTFQTLIRSPDVLGNVELGVQLYRVNGFEVRAEYSLKAGSAYLAQSGGARIAWHF